MKLIKSYKLYLESNNSRREVVTEFLIYNERKYGLCFDRFDIIDDENGYIKSIIGYTKIGPKGEIPNVDKIVYDIIDFNTWLIENDFPVKGYNYEYSTWRTPKTLHEKIQSMKTDILRKILFNDLSILQVEPRDDDKKLLDKAFNFKNLWDEAKDKVKKIISIISKYNIEDMDDRLIEFTDEIPQWNHTLNFAYYINKSWHIFGKKINIDDITCRMIWDAWYRAKADELSIMDYLHKVKPVLFVKLNDNDATIEHNLYEIEKIVDRMVIRFKQLYNIEDVLLPYYRNERKYDPKNSMISDYDITFILK